MISQWFIPSACGDFRLVEDPEGSRLVVLSPTEAERHVLRRFLLEAHENGWLRDSATLQGDVQSIVLLADASEVAPCLSGLLVGEDALTVVRVDGKVIPVAEATPGGAAAVRAPSEEEAEALESAQKKEKKAAAVTTRRPTLCCPTPGAGPDVRASEVLRTFCTRRQWEDWTQHGYLHAIGHLSGHRYRIHHRHHPESQRQKYITYDLDDRQVLHGYMWSVPPAEEVLAFKLYLEHAEPYVRNEASGFSTWFKRARLDPKVYGGLLFGVADRQFHEGLALGLGVSHLD